MIPDAWFELAVGLKRPVAIAIELDRGSEDQKRWRAKVAALAACRSGPTSRRSARTRSRSRWSRR